MPRGKRANAPTPPPQGVNGSTGEPAGPGHNSQAQPLTPDQRFVLTHRGRIEYEAALAAKKEAAAKFLTVTKRLKAEIGPDAIDRVKAMIALDTPEGERQMKALIEMQLEIARYRAAPLGTQFGLFEDRSTGEERAFAEGRALGLVGGTCVCSYDPSVPQYASFMDGYHDGQGAILAGIKPMSDGQPVANETSDGRPIGSVSREEFKSGMAALEAKGAEIIHSKPN